MPRRTLLVSEVTSEEGVSGVVDVTEAPFGASPNATASYNAAAFEAAIDSIDTGVIFFPPGAYSTNGSLTPKTGITFKGSGMGSTRINYSGTGFLFDLGATGLADDVGFNDFSVFCSGSALGPFRIGRTTETYAAALLRQRWHFNNLYCQGSSPSLAGSYGIQAVEYIEWTLSNVTFNNFRFGGIWQDGGNSTHTRTRYQSYAFGPKWRNTQGPSSDVAVNPEFLGPTTSGAAGVDYGYTVEIDAQSLTFIGALYEPGPGGESQAFVHIMPLGSTFKDINGVFSSSAATPDNSIVCDNLYYSPKFEGTYCGASENPISFGTVLAPAIFDNVADNLAVLAAAESITKSIIVAPSSASAYTLRTPELALTTTTISINGSSGATGTFSNVTTINGIVVSGT